jgi:AcrR family transcriptional regulator
MSLSRHLVCERGVPYTNSVPKLWNETIETHRRDVRAAVIETTAALVAEQGLRGVTMSRIAEQSGIGRATLYKYFPDVDAILAAWHEEQVTDHLAAVAVIAESPEPPDERLQAVLETFALMLRKTADSDHGTDLVLLLHRGSHMPMAEKHLQSLIAGLIEQGVVAGLLRSDVPASELAAFSLNAVSGTQALSSEAAVKRLVAVTMSGLRSN